MSRSGYTFSQIGLVLLIALIGIPGFAQEDTVRMRGVKRSNNNLDLPPIGRNMMFVIGIDEYKNWLALRNAASDARGMEEIFAEKFGFVPVAPALYNGDATKENIMKSLDEIRMELEPDDNFILFFAGHGETRKDSVGKALHETGYLIPVEGGDPYDEQWSSYIEVGYFLQQVALLPARHVTVILDACHSGIAMGGTISSTRGSEDLPINSLAAPPSRRVITSARKDQLASDDGPLANHSLFTGMMIKGLRNGSADGNQDGRVLTTEIGTYLSQEVREYSRDKQTPDFGSFLLDERGEMVLELKSNTPSRVIAQANALLAAGKTFEFIAKVRELDAFDNLPASAYYMRFRRYLIQNKIDSAEMMLQARLDMQDESELAAGSIEYLAFRDLQNIQKFIDYWQSYLVVTDSMHNVKVEIIHADTSVERINGSGVHGRYALPSQGRFFFRITNEGDYPIHPFALYFDEYGRGSQKALWKDVRLITQGLQPGESAESYVMTHYGNQGLKEFRLFFSPEMILEFFKPQDVMNEEEKPKLHDNLSMYSIRMIFDRASRVYTR